MPYYARPFQRLDGRLVRVAVVVLRGARDDGLLRTDLAQERRVRAVVRPVVRDLDDRRLRERPDRLALFLLGVGHEERREAPVGDAQNEAVVVDVALRPGDLPDGREDVDDRRADALRKARLRAPEADFLLRDRFEEPPLEPRPVLVSAVPDLADLERIEDVRHAAEVVGVRVRQHEDVDLPDAEVLQIADDGRPRVGRSRVDEHGRAVRELHENRVPLADVDDVHGDPRRKRGGRDEKAAAKQKQA